MSERKLQLEVLLCLQNRTVLQQVLHCPQGTTFAQAIAILETRLTDMPASLRKQLPVTPWVWGIFGRRSILGDYRLCEHDRIELYQPLKVDPKVARRERFAKQGSRGAGLFAQKARNEKE